MTRWTPLGDRAVRFPRPRSSPKRLTEVLRTWPGVIDVVVAAQDVAVYFEGPPSLPPLETLEDLLDEPGAARTVELQASYDGPDLAELEEATGLDVAQLHREGTYVVETMGFLPGFAYLGGLSPSLHLPRRSTPRARVPAGSIGLAGGHTGVYPFDSPGGWHLIGRVVGTALFGPDGPLLQLGDRVVFR